MSHVIVLMPKRIKRIIHIKGERMRPITASSSEIAKICYVTPAILSKWLKNSFRSRLKKEFKNDSFNKILVVDDESGIRDLVNRILKKKYGENIEVLSSSNGFEAGEKAEQYRPNLMILDIRLPGIDGFEVCSIFKSRENLKNTKILAISGNNMPMFRDKALRSGADDFLGKPFSQNQLIEKIEDLMNTKECL
jgi:chemosensory pili system protein ChpA (sensor histidine kinase/response regulator)